MNVVKRDDTRRHSLEFVFENASYHVDQLNDVLENAETSMPEDADATRAVTEAVKRECEDMRLSLQPCYHAVAPQHC